MWLKDDGCRNTVNVVWGLPSPVSDLNLVSSKINLCGVKLVEWSQSAFGSVKRQLSEASKMLVLAEEAAAGAALMTRSEA